MTNAMTKIDRLLALQNLKVTLTGLNLNLSEKEKIQNPTQADLEEVKEIKAKALEVTSAIRNIRRNLGYNIA